jgi:tetratricopeptide (TPR) repeat protein
MRERFRLLAGMHGAAARHATLQATIDWSWQLLAPSEQDALAQCATFDGSFTLEAAEAVINLAHRPDAPSAMDAIQALCDKSLLRTWLGAESRSATDRPVLRMYLSVHDFAAQKLAAAPADVRAGVEQRHGAYYAAFGSTAAIESLSRDGGVARRRAVSRSLDNLVTACRRAVRRGDGAQAVDAFIAAAAVLDLQGPGGLAVTLGAEALASSGLPPVPRTRALTIYGTALRRSGRTEEAERAFETALALARAQREARLEAGVLLDLGSLRQGQGRMAESRACAEESLRLARGIGDRRLEGGLANNLGILDALQGQYASARARFEAALALHREVGDLQSEGLDTVNLANLARIEDRNEEAIELFLRALVIQRDVGDRRNEGLACGNLAALHARAGRLDEGERFVEHALAIHREVGNRHSEGSHLATQGELLGRRGRYDEAREAFRRGERLLRDLADPESLALLLCERAGVEVAAGDRDAARSALDEAEALLTELELGSDSEPGRRLMELRAALA